jgi:hypothetical protein
MNWSVLSSSGQKSPDRLSKSLTADTPCCATRISKSVLPPKKKAPFFLLPPHHDPLLCTHVLKAQELVLGFHRMAYKSGHFGFQHIYEVHLPLWGAGGVVDRWSELLGSYHLQDGSVQLDIKRIS